MLIKNKNMQTLSQSEKYIAESGIDQYLQEAPDIYQPFPKNEDGAVVINTNTSESLWDIADQVPGIKIKRLGTGVIEQLIVANLEDNPNRLN
jgi:hypothetical protein